MKCNFHIHDNDSNENESPNTKFIFSAYKDAGYDIVVNSDQKNYYDTRKIAEELNIKSYNGEEYAEHDGILLIGTTGFIKGEPQDAIDICHSMGGFAVACHPNENPFFEKMGKLFNKNLIKKVRNLDGIEIFNGCIGRGKYLDHSLGRSLATDVWDELLSEGTVIWGFGSDDSHGAHEINVSWTNVFAKSSDFSDVKDSIKKGKLYASTGLSLTEFSLIGDKLVVSANYLNEQADNIFYRFIGKNGLLLKSEFGKSSSITLNKKLEYVRVEAFSNEGFALFTQPILNKEYFKEI